jgi:hypothetical protein
MTIAISFSSQIWGQQTFRITSFKQLPNDISAYINPVRDLNQEACALVKVVGDKDFVFSSPLGIVHRSNEVGEIWIYLPKGSKLLTIKHPQWGVMRNFRFDAPLESRMTYELILTPPLSPEYDLNIPIGNNPQFPYISYTPLHSDTDIPSLKVKQPLVWQLLYISGWHRDSYSGGVMLAVRRRHGIYLHIQSDFRQAVSTEGECEKDGTVAGGSASPYYNGMKKDARWVACIGGIHHLTQHIDIYEGIGYGHRSLAWQKVDGNYMLNNGYSAKGIAGEAGAIYEFHLPIYISAGIMTIKGKYWEPVIGVGYKF